jgi:hypothetical protein
MIRRPADDRGRDGSPARRAETRLDHRPRDGQRREHRLAAPTGRRYIIGAPKSELKKFSSDLAHPDGWRTVHEGVREVSFSIRHAGVCPEIHARGHSLAALHSPTLGDPGRTRRLFPERPLLARGYRTAFDRILAHSCRSSYPWIGACPPFPAYRRSRRLGLQTARNSRTSHHV